MSVYIGYDLGDGDTSISVYYKENAKWNMEQVAMPQLAAGEAMPSIVGKTPDGKVEVGAYALTTSDLGLQELSINFKRRPSTLTKNEFSEFKEQVVMFTNELFSLVKGQCFAKDVFSVEKKFILAVGHPTTWTDDDIEKYRSIIIDSDLFKKTDNFTGRKETTISLQLHPESHAALMNFINSKNGNDDYAISVEDVPVGKCAVVFDFGSSTADVTVLQNNGGVIDADGERLGNSNLGARYIDAAIYEEIVKSLDEDDKERFEKLLKVNQDTLPAQCKYYCRLAKQQYYIAVSQGKNANSCSYLDIRRKGFSINNYFSDEVMRCALAHKFKELGGRSFEEACIELMRSVKKHLQDEKRNPVIVFLTGGASRMDFISRIAKDTFPESKIIADSHPSRCISHGLAYLPHRLEKRQAFLDEVKKFIDKRIPEIVSNNMSNLVSPISSGLTELILSTAKSEVLKWRRGGYMTLNGMDSGLNSEVKAVLNSSRAGSVISSALNNFIKSNVSKKVQEEFSAICKRNGVLEQKDVLNGIGDVHNSGFSAEVRIAEQISREIDAAISEGVGELLKMTVITLLSPIIVIIVAMIATWLSIPIIGGLCAVIFSILALIPGAGWAILLAIAGASLVYVTLHGIDAIKSKCISGMKGWDLPQWVRNRISDSKISDIISGQKYKVSSEIESAINKDANFSTSVSKEIGATLGRVINKIANDLVLRIRD